MRIFALVGNSKSSREATVSTPDSTKSTAMPLKRRKSGSSINRGKLLMRAFVCMAVLIGSASAASVPSQDQRSLERLACPFDTAKALLRVDCGRLRVPENYDRPGRNIEVAFMIVRASRNIDPHHPVIFLSGGPGSPSLVYAEMYVANPQVHDIVVDRDWVFIDQRGTGRSLPALRCESGKDYLARVQHCWEKLSSEGVDLSQYNSVRSARDIEELRKALGVQQWNLWGISYGSRLAFAVARDFSASVHAIIHDGPSYPEGQEIIDDFRGTDAAINRLFSKCIADAACASKYPDLRKRFLAALPRLRRQPLQVGDERIDDEALVNYIRGYLFTGNPALLERQVQNLLAYIDAASRVDAEAMRRIKLRMPEVEDNGPPVPVEGWYSLGQNLSVECNEERSFESLTDYRQAAAQSEIVRASFGADGGAAILKDCAIWRSGRADRTRKARVHYEGPQLMFSGELDASLSGLSGDRIAKLYPNARNVVFRNAIHGQVELDDVPPASVEDYRACALRLARAFMADPKKPLDTRCAQTRGLRLVP